MRLNFHGWLPSKIKEAVKRETIYEKSTVQNGVQVGLGNSSLNSLYFLNHSIELVTNWSMQKMVAERN